MQPARQKWQARFWLALVALAGLAWLGHIDYSRKISTDVLDLIPTDERSPELAMVRSLAGDEQARVALFALRQASSAATRAFVASLSRSPAMAEVARVDDPGPRNAMGKVIYSHRFDLLLPAWLEARRRDYVAAHSDASWPRWLARRAAADLEAFLSRPEAVGLQDLTTSDPLLLVPGLLDRVHGLSDGGVGGGEPAAGVTLIWARTSRSPLRPEGQGPVFAAVEEALAAARAAGKPGESVQLEWTGVSRYAAASRQRIERELSLLNLLSLGCVLAIATICVHRVYRAAHLIAVVAGSLLGAWVAVTAVWERLHILVFVLGSLLAGVAIDYGFYVYLQPRRRPGETYREKAGRLIKPLLASALTTVIGFSLLLFSELPLIRQLGVFVSAGLVSALGTALLWFAQVDDPYLETRPFVRVRLAPGAASPRARRAAQILLFAGLAVALIGPWRLRWRDDIRELQIPTPALEANDRAVRTLFGETEGRTLYLTRGDTVGDARAALGRFLAWHAATFPGTDAATLGYALPTEQQWRNLPASVAALGDFESELSEALELHGFEPSAFDGFFHDWRQWRRGTGRLASYDALAKMLIGSLRGPMESLAQLRPGQCWFATIASHPPGADPPPDTSTVTDEQLQTLNRLFARYRVSALRLSSLGLGLLGASVLALYGPRRGVRIFAIPCGACLFAFGVFGLMGETLNLFNLLGAFLGVCLSHNYAIFSAESAFAGQEPPPSIRMSALAAASSFGVLGLSRIPVVAALGSTVAAIVIAALVLVELGPMAGLAVRRESGAKPHPAGGF